MGGGLRRHLGIGREAPASPTVGGVGGNDARADTGGGTELARRGRAGGGDVDGFGPSTSGAGDGAGGVVVDSGSWRAVRDLGLEAGGDIAGTPPIALPTWRAASGSLLGPQHDQRDHQDDEDFARLRGS